jgi:4-hydroxy-3-methylbut-2-enyl diphosphate reductase
VTKVHVEVAKMREHGREIVMIGHRGHPEVEGTMGQSTFGMYLVEKPEDVPRLGVKDEKNLAFVTQTTLSVDDAQQTINALKARFAGIVGPKKDDICYATQNRQDAVKALARQCEVVIVVGSPNSSNSRAWRPTWWTTPRSSSPNGWRASVSWASPPGPRRPRCW